MTSHPTHAGIELLRAMQTGQLPPPPIAELFDMRLREVDVGRVVFEALPTRAHYNPQGTVHGGFAATLLDTSLGCSVLSTLAAGVSYTTLELKVNYVRAMTDATGLVRSIGETIHTGRSTGIAEARIVDSEDRLLAHATTTCLIFQPE